MEWFAEDIERGQRVLTFVTLAFVVALVWFGRKKLSVSVPITLLILFLAAIVIPSAIPARPTTQRNACIYNLRMIQEAKSTWARAHVAPSDYVLTEADLISANSVVHHRPECPLGGTYIIGSLGQSPKCSLAANGHLAE
ncbi:MAG: hypothetical protein HOH33_16735 [Verrucomicrobia bacterium]|jgi:hypothetical protein|nr:hypothetical protein [Verrucomicrobiota bacterium]